MADDDGDTALSRRGRRHEELMDEAAGPVVRPFALIGGRTAPVRDDFDLVAIIKTAGTAGTGSGAMSDLAPEHETILQVCRTPMSVAEVASEVDLALGVVRVLLGDLFDAGLIVVRRPAPVAQFPNERVLKDVIDGLRAL